MLTSAPLAATAAAASSRLPPRARRNAFGLYVLSVVAGLAAWQAAASQFSHFILAPPISVLSRLLDLMTSGELPQALANASLHTMAGFAIAVAIALPLGIAVGRIPALGDLLSPLFNLVYSVPPIAWVPLIIIWFGLFMEARIAVVVLMTVFDMLFVVAEGAKNVDRRLVNVGRAFGAGRRQVVTSILLPALVPFLFAALRLGVIRAVNAMVTAELFLASVNLGAIMTQASARFDSAAVLGVILILSVIGLVLQEVVLLVERRVCTWSAGA